jgi:5'-3' exonuclease
MCSSARGKSGKLVSWHDAVLVAFADEARQIRNAQQKGMAVYAGALE